MKVFHIITGLNNGGAEGVLYRLCVYPNTTKHIVISLMDEGKYGPLLLNESVSVHCLNMPPGKVTLSGLIKLYRLIKHHKPDVIQTWMYHADLIGSIIGKMAGVKNIYWGVRNSTLDSKYSKKSTILVAKICSLLSYIIPTKIIYCAQKASQIHHELGYDSSKLTVIFNGFDLDRFNINKDFGYSIKNELKLDVNVPFIGMVGRYDPQKDHENLLLALNEVKSKGYNFRCALIGKDLSLNNKVLMSHVRRLELCENVILLEQRTDIPAIMNAIDINILSSSFGEGFPNVLAEAMACGTPCISTDVGDSEIIIGDTGWIVPVKNPGALSDALIAAIKAFENKDSWILRRELSRKRIENYFSIAKMVNEYHKVWSS